MIPLEEKMLEKFDMSKFVVCTDAGLSSATNRVFNSYDGEDGMRAYITTQPIKTLKGFLQEWCMADDGWTLDEDDSGKKYKISELDDEQDKDKIFYKTRWIKEEGIVHTDRGDKLHYLFYRTYRISISRKEIVQQIYHRPDTSCITGNGFHKVRGKGISACIYKDRIDG